MIEKLSIRLKGRDRIPAEFEENPKGAMAKISQDSGIDFGDFFRRMKDPTALGPSLGVSGEVAKALLGEKGLPEWEIRFLCANLGLKYVEETLGGIEIAPAGVKPFTIESGTDLPGGKEEIKEILRQVTGAVVFWLIHDPLDPYKDDSLVWHGGTISRYSNQGEVNKFSLEPFVSGIARALALHPFSEERRGRFLIKTETS